MATAYVVSAAAAAVVAAPVGQPGAAPPSALAPSAVITMTSSITTLAAIDQSRIAAGLADGRIAIWNGSDAAPQLEIPAHKSRVLTVAASTDSRRVLSLAADGTLAESPTAKGAAGRTRRLELGPAPARAAVFSPDKTRLVVGGEFGDVRVFDVESGKLRHELRGHRAEIQDLAMHPQSAMIASAGADADLRIWDTATGRQSGFVDSDVSMFAVAFSPRDGTLASGGVDRRVTLREPKNFSPVGTFALVAPQIVATLGWSPDGRLLAVGDIDDTTLGKGGLRVIDASTRAGVATLATGGVPPTWTVFFGDGIRVASAMRRELRAWSLPIAR
jgi:WD40 repeat protein